MFGNKNSFVPRSIDYCSYCGEEMEPVYRYEPPRGIITHVECMAEQENIRKKQQEEKKTENESREFTLEDLNKRVAELTNADLLIEKIEKKTHRYSKPAKTEIKGMVKYRTGDIDTLALFIKNKTLSDWIVEVLSIDLVEIHDRADILRRMNEFNDHRYDERLSQVWCEVYAEISIISIGPKLKLSL